MSIPVGFLIGFTGGITTFALILTARWAWKRAETWATQHLQHLMTTALTHPINTTYRNLEDEHQQLLAHERDTHD